MENIIITSYRVVNVSAVISGREKEAFMKESSRTGGENNMHFTLKNYHYNEDESNSDIVCPVCGMKNFEHESWCEFDIPDFESISNHHSNNILEEK